MTIIVFAKAPLPGYAKTRLASHIGNDKAAELAARMLRAAVEQAVQADCGPVELCCTPDTGHRLFQQLRDEFGIRLSLQGEGDLGQRMRAALARALQSNPFALLTGTDAPSLDAQYLRTAAQVLRFWLEPANLAHSPPAVLPAPAAPSITPPHHTSPDRAVRSPAPAVFAPTFDGGYALIGVTQDIPSLFSDMPWSTPQVMPQTRARLARAGLAHTELPMLHDVDEAADLIHLPPEWIA